VAESSAGAPLLDPSRSLVERRFPDRAAADLGLGLTQFQHRTGDWVLAAAGGAAIVATFVLMRYYARLQQSPGRM
jgi:hypothetical protein